MTEETRKVCCAFESKDADEAVKRIKKYGRILLREEPLSRRENILYQCKLCGAYIYYDYEEVANWSDDWDNADILEYYCPASVEIKTAEGKEPEYEISPHYSGRRIHGHNLELDRVFWYNFME